MIVPQATYSYLIIYTRNCDFHTLSYDPVKKNKTPPISSYQQVHVHDKNMYIHMYSK